MRREYCVINVLHFLKFFCDFFFGARTQCIHEDMSYLYTGRWRTLRLAGTWAWSFCDAAHRWGDRPWDLIFSGTLLVLVQNVIVFSWLLFEILTIIILLKNIPLGPPRKKILKLRILTLQLLAGPPPRKSQGRPVRSGTRRLKSQATAGKLFRNIAFTFWLPIQFDLRLI